MFRFAPGDSIETPLARFRVQLNPHMENVTAVQIDHIGIGPNLVGTLNPQATVIAVLSHALTSPAINNLAYFNGIQFPIAGFTSLGVEAIRTNLLNATPHRMIYDRATSLSVIDLDLVDDEMNLITMGIGSIVQIVLSVEC